jgi:hypothetical protein
VLLEKCYLRWWFSLSPTEPRRSPCSINFSKPRETIVLSWERAFCYASTIVTTWLESKPASLIDSIEFEIWLEELLGFEAEFWNVARLCRPFVIVSAYEFSEVAVSDSITAMAGAKFILCIFKITTIGHSSTRTFDNTEKMQNIHGYSTITSTNSRI